MSVWLWLLCICLGGIVSTVVGYLLIDAYRHRTLGTVLFILGGLCLSGGLLGVLGAVHYRPPTTIEVRVDRVEYVERLGLVVVNFLDEQGHILPQFRQIPTPEALAELLRKLVDNHDVRSFVTFIGCDEQRRCISKVEVWPNRYGPPEIHEFRDR